MCHLVTLVCTPSPPRCDVTFSFFKKLYFLFWNRIFLQNLSSYSWKIKKMSHETLTNPLPPLCDIWWHCSLSPPQECHVLFEWSLRGHRFLTTVPMLMLIMILNNFRKIVTSFYKTICNFQNSLSNLNYSNIQSFSSGNGQDFNVGSSGSKIAQFH